MVRVNSEGVGGPGSSPVDYTKFRIDPTGGGVAYSEVLDESGGYSFTVTCSDFGCYNENDVTIQGSWNFLDICGTLALVQMEHKTLMAKFFLRVSLQERFQQ